jgi:hypothetical protein
MSLRLILLTLVLLPACGRSPEAKSSASESTSAPAPVQAEPAPTPVAATKREARPAEPAASARRAPAEEELQTEEREANPTSETVTLTLNISPPAKGVVMWGAKQMAKLTPDKPSIELQRPRASGPVDLEIRAEGFLIHHTRLHSDRNDKVNVRLVRPDDASGLFGYRSSTAATAAKAKK